MRLRSALLMALTLAACASLLLARAAQAKPALHQQIDALVARRLAELKIVPAGASSDAEFVRRVYLDLTGDAALVADLWAVLAALLDRFEADRAPSGLIASQSGRRES